MRIAVCDDEIIFLERICKVLEEWADSRGETVTIYRYMDGDSLMEGHQKVTMDLMILDIMMPMLNGMDTAKEIRNFDSKVPIIFFTSSQEYAVDSYEVQAFYYLMKPISKEKFFKVMDRYAEEYARPDEWFLARTETWIHKIMIKEVVYIEARNKYVSICLKTGRILEVRQTFSKCEEIFIFQQGFFKCHRSYIVNLEYVKEFTKNSIQMDQNDLIPIARNHYTAFKEAYFNYMFSK